MWAQRGYAGPPTGRPMKHWMEYVAWEVMVCGQRLGRPWLGRLEKGPDSMLPALTAETHQCGVDVTWAQCGCL